jgi:hypothetical protein
VTQGELLYDLPPDRGAAGTASGSQSEFPRASVLCVRTATLEDFIREHSEPATAIAPQAPNDAEKALGTRERNTLLTIIAALAKEANVDISKASKAGETISQLIAAMGHRVAPNTVAHHLRILRNVLLEPEGSKAQPE